ncbi:MAG: tetratricopeptide repeat protein [Chloroflexaceae bacterium]|nr:tetratricopeptide repeat protein [Chloroflexaceae bacterium]
MQNACAYVRQRDLWPEDIDVRWRLTAVPGPKHPSAYLERVKGSSIGAAWGLGLLHLLDFGRRPIDLSESRWAVTGALALLPNGRDEVRPVSGYLRKLDAVMGANLKVIIPAADRPSVHKDWLSALPRLESASTIEEISTLVTTYGSSSDGRSAQPSRPLSPPHYEDLLDRADVLAYYREKVETLHFVVITGIPGTGKTVLATLLAHQLTQPDKIFWHRFQEQDALASLIWALAGFLAWHGQQGVWQQLQSSRNMGETFDPEHYIHSLIEMLRHQSSVLCLDDFHLVDMDIGINSFVKELRSGLAQSATRLIMTSQRTPRFVPEGTFKPLNGMSLPETRQLFARHHLVLSDPDVASIHNHLHGNPYWLTLAVDALKQSLDQSSVMNRLLEKRDPEDITHYLQEQTNASLSADERAMMCALTVLRGDSGTKEILAAITLQSDPTPVLERLSERSLVRVNEGYTGKQYSLHDLLRVFYDQHVLEDGERQSLHRRAASSFADSSDELANFKAAQHCYHARDYALALEYYAKDARMLIDIGRGNALQQGLEDVDRAYQQEIRQAQIRQCYAMGAALRYKSPDRAKERLAQGLDLLASQPPDQDNAFVQEMTGHMHRMYGALLTENKEYSRALSHLEQSLRVWSAESDAYADVLIPLANLHIESEEGDDDYGFQCYERALAIYNQTGNDWGKMAVLHNIGIEHDMAGNWERARRCLQQAIQLAEQRGALLYQAQTELSLGTLRMNQGDDAEATVLFEHVIEVARKYHYQTTLVAGLSSLADLKLRSGDTAAALPLLREAQTLAYQEQARDQLAEIYRGWALVSLVQGNLVEAHEHAQEALRTAQENQDRAEQGKSQRVLARVLAATDPAQAITAFEASLNILSDRYEHARTATEFARTLLSLEQHERAHALLQPAHTTFANLGAQRDAAVVETLLAACNVHVTTGLSPLI